jgi:hypothetical protein
MSLITAKEATVWNAYGKNVVYTFPETAVIPVVKSSLGILLPR